MKMQNICHICKKKSLKDHCHYTGEYRGAVHKI